jgi:hypothetical protein
MRALELGSTGQSGGAVAGRGGTRWILRLEGAAALLAGVAGFGHTGVSWWWFAALFLAPDISMAGYLRGPRVGAAIYNIGHNYLLPLLLGLTGAALADPLVMAVAAVWVAHIGFDRLLG